MLTGSVVIRIPGMMMLRSGRALTSMSWILEFMLSMMSLVGVPLRASITFLISQVMSSATVRRTVFLTRPGATTDTSLPGTHCAGSAAGSTVGVASNANIISVKVVDDNGGGSSSGVCSPIHHPLMTALTKSQYLAGIDYILSRHAERSAQPDFIASVLSLSLLFVGNLQTIDSATSEILDAGIFVSVRLPTLSPPNLLLTRPQIASGNFRDDACTYSPASLGGANGSAIVVGASDVNDSVSYYSNTGACVDVYAPGSDVVSAAVTGPADVKVDTGTSMAAPHVAGLLAYYVAQNRSIGSPAVAKEYLRETGFAGALALSAAYIGDQVPVLVNNGEL